MGFCVFNSIAIGARHAARTHGVERILIADWDVHHGNGTQAVFWSDGSVLFFDTHQHQWYPGTGRPDETGEGRGRGRIFNRPFPAGAGRDEILGAFRTELVPAAERFKPQLVMILGRLRFARRRSARQVHADRRRLRRADDARRRNRTAARGWTRRVGARRRLLARRPRARP